MKEQLKDFIQALVSDNTDQAKSIFNDVMDTKREEAIDLKKVAVAKKLYDNS